MAGGMNKRGNYGSMADRVAASQPAGPTPEPPPIKHCWVTGRYGRLPGLLLGWERTPTGFRGRVLHPVHDAEGWAVVEEWLPAELLEAALR